MHTEINIFRNVKPFAGMNQNSGNQSLLLNDDQIITVLNLKHIIHKSKYIQIYNYKTMCIYVPI